MTTQDLETTTKGMATLGDGSRGLRVPSTPLFFLSLSLYFSFFRPGKKGWGMGDCVRLVPHWQDRWCVFGFLGFEGLGLGFRIGLDRDLGTDKTNGDFVYLGFKVCMEVDRWGKGLNDFGMEGVLMACK